MVFFKAAFWLCLPSNKHVTLLSCKIHLLTSHQRKTFKEGTAASKHITEKHMVSTSILKCNTYTHRSSGASNSYLSWSFSWFLFCYLRMACETSEMNKENGEKDSDIEGMNEADGDTSREFRLAWLKEKVVKARIRVGVCQREDAERSGSFTLKPSLASFLSPYSISLPPSPLSRSVFSCSPSLTSFWVIQHHSHHALWTLH